MYYEPNGKRIVLGRFVFRLLHMTARSTHDLQSKSWLVCGMLNKGVRTFLPQTLVQSPAGGAIMGQQFCTLTQKSLIFKGFSCFLGVQNTPLSPLHLFLNLMDLSLRLYRTFEKRCDVNDESTVCYFPCCKVNNFMNITNRC